MAMVYESQVSASMGGLRTLFGALRQDPERKTVVVLSGGLLASDRAGGRPDVSGVITTLGELRSDIMIGAHPSVGDLDGKLKRRAVHPDGPNPFIEPGACRTLAATAMKGLDDRVALGHGKEQ